MTAPGSSGARLALAIMLLWLGAVCLYLAVDQLRPDKTSESGLATIKGQLGELVAKAEGE